MKRNIIDQKGDYTRYEVEREQPLLEFLLEKVKGQSKSKIKATLQGHGVLVGKTCVTKFDYMLKPGMCVAVSNTKRNLNICFARC